MILYLVYDKKNNTCTHPALAIDVAEATQALHQINPENLSDLIIYPICTINSIYDFFILSPDQNKKLPEFLITRSDSVTPESTQQAGGALDHAD